MAGAARPASAKPAIIVDASKRSRLKWKFKAKSSKVVIDNSKALPSPADHGLARSTPDEAPERELIQRVALRIQYPTDKLHVRDKIVPRLSQNRHASSFGPFLNSRCIGENVAKFLDRIYQKTAIF
jgi:hypothetical protein